MVCPTCSSNLQIHKHTLGEVDICPKCAGVWFENNRLKPYLIHLHKAKNLPHLQARSKTIIIASHQVEETPKTCPKCQNQMEFFNYAYDSNIIIDKCSKCNGFWADEEEAILLAIHLKGNQNYKHFAKAVIKDIKSAETQYAFTNTRSTSALILGKRGKYTSLYYQILLELLLAIIVFLFAFIVIFYKYSFLSRF